jgi:hypothetical protein
LQFILHGLLIVFLKTQIQQVLLLLKIHPQCLLDLVIES